MSVPVTNSAVNEAVDRLLVFVKAAAQALSPAIDRVDKTVIDAWKPPYIWIFPGAADFLWRTAEYQDQTYVANIRLVLGTRTQSGYKGVLVAHLWTAVPTIANYLHQRRHFLTTKGQSPVPGLKTENVVIGPASPFGDFDNSDVVGIDLPVTLPFEHITVKPVLPSG